MYCAYVCMYVGVGMGGWSVLIDTLYIRTCIHVCVKNHVGFMYTYLHMSEPLMWGSAHTHVFIVSYNYSVPVRMYMHTCVCSTCITCVCIIV